MIYSQIMVAIDGRETSNLALREAVRLAKDQDAMLRIIYVVDESIANYIEGYVDFDALWDAYKEEGNQILNRIDKEVKKEKVNFETRLIELKPAEGCIAEKIAAEARNWPADVLVMGTHGRRGLSHFFLGSIAEQVIHLSTVPVLLLRSES